MANLFRFLTRDSGFLPLSVDEFAQLFTFNGVQYPIGLNQTITGNREEIRGDFAGLVQGAYKQNGVVFACMLVRMLLFSEARFMYRQLRSGRPGDMFSQPELDVLRDPWPGGTTGDLLTRAIQDADLAGNWFGYRRTRDRIVRLRPDWVDIVLGSEREDAEVGDVDIEPVGYMYHPGGRDSGRDPVPLLREQVAHFAPIPDPMASYRGMSWLTPAIRDILADQAMTTHKSKFFENGATPNMVVKLNPDLEQDAFDLWVAKFRAGHESASNAYKTLFLGGGADATVVGSQFKQIDFKVTQGAGETRIAADAGVPPVLVGLSEGLASATYSNYQQAKRRCGDGTMRPLWRNMAGSLSTIIRIPAGAELWYDDRDIPWLQEDVADSAKVQQMQSTSMATLAREGWDPDSVVEAITSGDFKRLKHTGMPSVQLQQPSSGNGGGDASKIELPAGAE